MDSKQMTQRMTPWQATLLGSEAFRTDLHANPFFSLSEAGLHLAWNIGYHATRSAEELRAKGVKPLRGVL